MDETTRQLLNNLDRCIDGMTCTCPACGREIEVNEHVLDVVKADIGGVVEDAIRDIMSVYDEMLYRR